MGLKEWYRRIKELLRVPEYTLQQLEDLYPDLKGWFPEHRYGVLLDKKRLPTGEEKAEILGGIELLKGNLGNAHLEEIILRGCRKVPMYVKDIGDFCKLIDPKSDHTTVAYILSRFSDPEIYDPVLVEKIGIIKIETYRNKPGLYFEYHYQAFLTTDQGEKGLPYGRKTVEIERESRTSGARVPQRV